MSNYSAVVVGLENVQKHPFADRLLVAIAAGEPVVIGLDHVEGEVGVFFPAGTIISHDFLMANKLYRKNPENDEPMGGYFESNRRVRFQKFRNAMSRGIWLPMSCLDYLCLENIPVVGTQFQELEGHELVQKYIAPSTRIQTPGKARSKKFANFYEIGETPKLVLNFHRFKVGDVIVVTEKLHGTSGRTGYLKPLPKVNEDKKLTWWERFEKFVVENVFDLEIIEDEPDWGHVTGTRRMVLGENSPDQNNYRLNVHDMFKPHLSKGMIVYYEIVGKIAGMQTHTPNGITDKELKKDLMRDYGEEINYTYGVPDGLCDVYVYKIVEHNVDDIPYVYSWDQLVTWCKAHGFKHVPVLDTILFESKESATDFDDIDNDIDIEEYWHGKAKERLKFLVGIFCEGASVLDHRHPKEGVVLQTKYGAFKHKSDAFCMLEDIRPYEEPELEEFDDEETV